MTNLLTLAERWGEERIRAAIQALYIGEGDEPGDPPIAVVNASINDRQLWESLSDEEREILYLACLETQYDIVEICQASFDVLEPIGDKQPTLTA